MAKRRNGWNEDKIVRYFTEGRGSGELSNYKPWLTIQDVPSAGRVHRLKGWKTNRIHHLLSDLERDYFYLLDWASDVIDIREQYPLNREKTVQIAEKKRISHPVDSVTRIPIVCTTDFLITVRQGNKILHLARTTKPYQELNDKRVIEKFEIERQYWGDAGVDWGIVTELELPKEICKNIGWVHSSYNMEEEDIDLAVTLYDYIKGKDALILDILKLFDEYYAFEAGTALSCLKYLIAHKYVGIDMDKPLDLRASLSSLDFSLSNKPKGRLAT
ncbi:TnsA endonuclease N-terminal domain-containing protein [Phosphitispora fastidiosa]|uniref:TnsA endonuclease N-terminal domain-containing protein n=1 Tax=Phosphitispora fastidiosa TaxID=2837202 RepID=UPI001E53B068|nr:TnsA endonuclease N-terminal domain-containing protein [Phosphitispora fastidiosa]MBU7006887.1 hypothetical protein [Phosphitispora fastidiosa]